MAFSTFWQWSKTPASNTEINGKPLSDSGTRPTALDDIVREVMGQSATGLRKGSDVASAGTVTLGDGVFFHITGNTGPITDIDFTDAADGRWAILEFDSTPTITHNGTTLNLPGAANIVAAAGDRALIVQDSSDNVHVMFYQRAGGIPQLGPHIIIEDQKTSGTAGGDFNSGADRIRVINTEVYDPFGLCSISSNQFTLPAGTYIIRWSAPAALVDGHQSFLYNATDTSEVKRGTAEFASALDLAATRSEGSSNVTITASKAFEIRHRCQTSRASNGGGSPAGFGTEVYTRVEITKVA